MSLGSGSRDLMARVVAVSTCARASFQMSVASASVSTPVSSSWPRNQSMGSYFIQASFSASVR